MEVCACEQCELHLYYIVLKHLNTRALTLQLWYRPVGAPDRGDALQGHQRHGHRLRGRHEQAQPPHPHHLPRGLVQAHGGLLEVRLPRAAHFPGNLILYLPWKP